MKLLTRRERLILLAGGVLVGLALYFSFVIFPLQVKARAADEELSRAVELLKQARGAARENEEMDRRLVELGQRLKELEGMVPGDMESASFLSLLHRLELETGVRVESVSFAAASEESGYLRHPVDMAVIGEYSSIAGFLQRLEGGSRLLRVSALQLAPAGKEGGSPEFKAVLVVNLFSSKPAEAKAAAGSAARAGSGASSRHVGRIDALAPVGIID